MILRLHHVWLTFLTAFCIGNVQAYREIVVVASLHHLENDPLDLREHGLLRSSTLFLTTRRTVCCGLGQLLHGLLCSWLRMSRIRFWYVFQKSRRVPRHT